MKKIAVINDLSGLGKCSLTAAIPVISAMGVQACPLPTAVLSNQTGYASYFCDDYTDRMDAYMEEWEKRGFQPDGIYTGFLAGEKQADRILDFFRRFCREETLVLTDPVMGDQGKAYPVFSEALCEKMKLLVSHATVITPNLTEALLLLYGREGMEKQWEALQRLGERAYLPAVEEYGKELLKRFPIAAAVITGIDCRKEGEPLRIGSLVCKGSKNTWFFAEKSGGSYSGTGDLFASVLSAGLVKGMPMERCVKMAVDFLSGAIRDTVTEGTDRNDGVCFESHLHELWQGKIQEPSAG